MVLKIGEKMTQEDIEALWSTREKLHEQLRKKDKITKKFEKLLLPYIEKCKKNGHKMPDGTSAFHSPYQGIRCNVCKICGVHTYPKD
jgi:hypothetical protein